MGSQTATLNTPVDWEVESTGDELTCADISSQIRNGVQIESPDINFEDVTITVISTRTGAQKVLTPPEDAGNFILVSANFSFDKIVISNVPVGTCNVCFSQ